jgi:arsenical pump membrane protein
MSFVLIYIISVLTVAGIIVRPFKINEAVWAVTGAALLVIFQQLSLTQAYAGVSKGTDVYLFLTGMMLLAETAREEKLFDWLAAHATAMAAGSSKKLFFLVYLVGFVVTAFLSNDATAVVLTPAVAAAMKAAKVKEPLPFLLICAFIANAASFVLPISNPANLVIYGSSMPSLFNWLKLFVIPSGCAIAATFVIHYFIQANRLKQPILPNISIPILSPGAKVAAFGIGATALALLSASSLHISLGLPAAITGLMVTAVVLLRGKKSPMTLIKGISWAILPLVAGLFVIVEAVNKTGITSAIGGSITQVNSVHPAGSVWLSGAAAAFACNILNNLPAGLVAGNIMQTAHLPALLQRAVLIGVDIGPNLSVTGSLATILWLVALKREGITVSAWSFFKLGLCIMLPALIFAIYSLWL